MGNVYTGQITKCSWCQNKQVQVLLMQQTRGKNQTNTQLMGNISVPQKQYLQSKTKDVLSPGGSTFKVGTSPLPSEFQHEGLHPGDFKNIVPEQLFQYT